MKVTSVGSADVNLPLIFDTGSAGVTLNALSLFPASMVTSSGFVFASGQTSISYQGITVTDQQVTRDYGTADNGRTQHGNLGFATVTFGDSAGTLKTARMPVFFYYSVTDRATGDEVTGQPQQGIFGVNDAPNEITVSGSSDTSATVPLCAADTTGSCYAVSPLKYLTYGSGIHAGFMLTPTALQTCDITTAGSCVGKPVLTVGLTPALEDGFTTEELTCPPTDYAGPQSARGFPVCVQAITNSTFTLSGTETGTQTTAILFDTGNPVMEIAVPSGSSFPASVPAGTNVLVTLPSGFTYSYTADTGNHTTNIISGTRSTVGLVYFTTHAFFVDFTSSTTGFK